MRVCLCVHDIAHVVQSMSLGRREFLSKHITSPVARVPRATREAAARSLGHLHPMVDKDIALHGPGEAVPCHATS